MNLNFRFAIASDLHIALPQTIWDHPGRFHLVELSIPALEVVIEHLETLEIDFLLLPGDLTQHGEAENHTYLQKRLASLPFPVYVVPGNHDVPSWLPTNNSIGFKDFPHHYRALGYENPHRLYYTREVLPGVQLVALNSNQFDASGEQLGCLDEEQLVWLEQVLATVKDQLVLVMIHHNVVEHLPGQSQHRLGSRYMLDNAPVLRQMLREAGVKLVFTGHLHVQDIAHGEGIYDVTTGSLVSYPHPYRILSLSTNEQGEKELAVESHRVQSVPGWENLPQTSREWMGDRSYPLMLKLLTESPLHLDPTEAEKLAVHLRYFWADISAGDPVFDFSDFPPAARRYLKQFSATKQDGTPHLIDNQAVIPL